MAARILIADDNPFIRQALHNLIEGNHDWEICGEATTGRDAVEKARCLHPDLILMDLRMPEMNGLAATQEIAQRMPSSRVLMFTMYLSPQLAEAARDAGALGAVAKGNASQVTRGIEAVLRNESYFKVSNDPAESNPHPYRRIT